MAPAVAWLEQVSADELVERRRHVEGLVEKPLLLKAVHDGGDEAGCVCDIDVGPNEPIALGVGEHFAR